MPILPIALGIAELVPFILKWFNGSDKDIDTANKVVAIAKKVAFKENPLEALEELQNRPELVVELKKVLLAQEQFFVTAEIEDRKSARTRDIEFIKADKYNFRADLLAFLAVSGLMICVYFIARDSTIPERAVNAIMFVAGVLAAAVRDVYSFEFGSSRGSKEKSDTISEALKNKELK